MPEPVRGWASWRALLRVYVDPDEDAAQLRARLLHWVRVLTPWLMALNIFTGTLLAALLPAAVPAPVRLAWCATVVGLCGRGLHVWVRHRDRVHERASPAVATRAALQAAVLACLWALVPWALAPGSAAVARQVVGAMMPCVMASGAFALCPLAPAALAFVGIVGLSSTLALASAGDAQAWVAGFTMAGFTCAVFLAILFGARRAVGAMRAERDSERQRHLVGMLLTDFESQSTDVLFETDGAGRFVRVSPRLALLMQLDREETRGAGLLEWFQRHADDDLQPGVVELMRRTLAEGQAFRQRGVPVRLDGATRWWSVTARPLADGAAGPQGWRGVITDITQEHEAQARARSLRGEDVLTGLANGIALRERLQSSLQAEPEAGVLLASVNLDHFRRINDLHGHGTGDDVLRETARRLRQSVRAGDLVARVAGDEFAVMAAETDGDDALRRFGERLVRDLSGPHATAGGPVVVGASVGIVRIPAHGRSVDELLSHADLALEAAKSAGRGRCQIFEPGMAERLRLRHTIERDLASAVERGELHLLWQPKVDTGDWRVTGCEALVRWQHPELGLVSPAQFIPVAEETGLIVEVGRWVLREACRVGAERLPGLGIAVNASTVQLARDDFPAIVADALAESGLSPRLLEIELTESVFLDPSSPALQNLEALRRTGVRVALDDFGTGYSSLAYLRRFPFDTLKIDRAFVSELVTRRDARAIVHGIVDLATALGMSTVAEGVEDPRQYDILRRAGCIAVQGYLVARPMPVEPLRELISGWDRSRAPGADDQHGMLLRLVEEIEAGAEETSQARPPGEWLH